MSPSFGILRHSHQSPLDLEVTEGWVSLGRELGSAPSPAPLIPPRHPSLVCRTSGPIGVRLGIGGQSIFAVVNKLRGCLPGGLLDGVEIGLCVERVWALELGRPNV